jgi:ribosomal protein L13E
MADDFRGINQETLKNVESLKGSIKEIADATAAANRQLQQQGRLIQDYRSNFSSIVTSASQFAKLQDEASRSASATSKALSEQQKQLSNVRSLNAQIENLMDQMVNASKEEEKLLLRQVNNLSAARDNARELANAYEELVDSSSKLDKSTMWFSAFSEVVKDIPGLRKLSGPFEAAAKAARETAISNAKVKSTNETIASLGEEALRTGRGLTKEKLKELGLTEQAGNLTGSAAAQALKSYQQNNKVASTGIAGMQAGFKALGPIIKGALGPLAIITTIVSVIKFFVTAMFEADKRITDISKNLSISKESAEGIYDNIIATKKSTDDLRYTTTELTKAFNELADLSDFTNIATRDQLVTQVELTKMLGLQVDEALQLQELFAVNNIEAEKGVDTVYDQIAAFANQNKIVADGNVKF